MIEQRKISDTSREAFQNLASTETMEDEVLALLKEAGPQGMIADDIALILAKSHENLQSGTIAARLMGLEIKGKACQTIHTDLTRNNRPAHVWKLPEFTSEKEVVCRATGKKQRSTQQGVNRDNGFFSLWINKNRFVQISVARGSMQKFVKRFVQNVGGIIGHISPS